jgi:hypothetical protein
MIYIVCWIPLKVTWYIPDYPRAHHERICGVETWLHALNTRNRMTVNGHLLAAILQGKNQRYLLYNGYRVFLGGKAAGAWC